MFTCVKKGAIGQIDLLNIPSCVSEVCCANVLCF